MDKLNHECCPCARALLERLEKAEARVEELEEGAGPVLRGKAAEDFLAEMRRIENLSPDSEEFKQRAAFLEECRQVYEKSRPK